MKSKFLLTLLCASALTVASRADDALNAAAKKIFAEKKDSVVWVTGIAKTSFATDSSQETPMNIPDRETKVEALATIIDSSGLLVTALAQIDPSRSVNTRSLRRTTQGPAKVEATSTLKDVKVLMPDGTEIPAEVVMKDTDLDLAFVRVKAGSKEAKGVTFSAVDLANNAPGDILEDVVTLGRMDEGMNYAAHVTRGQINTLTTKPRLFLRAGGATAGCPTFLANGKLLGITAARFPSGKTPFAVIIPAADVLQIAEQAKTAKPAAEPEAKKPEAAEPKDK
jgi:S1-C subfamily serine protease